ncbi:phage major capsid protein [Paradevosia shaoguanensis]|uniref:phage major capsid protein n=1 Tax=Paradevosia shaoguanensis TaxID=1335043 RepID=UPI0019330080|nr:phage major capsid protein [Paradevosia shaoguanensis]
MPTAIELRQKRTALIAEARKVLNDIEKCSDEKRLPQLENRHDQLMTDLDAIDAQLTRHERNETQERLDANYRAGRSEREDDERRERMRPNPGGREVAVDGYDTADEPTETISLRSNQSFAEYVIRKSDQGEADEFRGLSEGAYLRAMVTGAKNDLEKRALAEGTDSAGGYTVPEILSARMIDRLRRRAVVFRAGAQTVPLNSDVSYVAKVATDPVPAWRVENAAVQESDPTFGRVTFTARSLAVLVKVSRELIEDSLNIETALPDVMATALALELDRVSLLGTGTAPEPRGVANFAGLTANGYAGGVLGSYSPLIKARTALRTANSDVTAYVMSPRDEGHLAELTATDDQPLIVPPSIAQTPFLTTSAMPTNLGTDTDESFILAGDWARLMVGLRSEIRIEILRERFADNLQYGFLAHLRADVAAEHEAAFTKLSAITIA